MRSIDIGNLNSDEIYKNMQKYYLPDVVFDLIPISFLNTISGTIYNSYNKEFTIEELFRLPIFLDEKVKLFKI